MRRFLFFLLFLGTCLAAAAHPGPSRQSKTEAGPGSDTRSLPASSVAASPSPETRVKDEEEEQLDRLRHFPKTETERESRADAPVPPSAARRSSTSASGEENDELPKEETRESNPESYRKYAGVKFSPADLADYIARTATKKAWPWPWRNCSGKESSPGLRPFPIFRR
ncbi:uncharacterized protein [Centruroides vittatus]|uniref:uncharacterized protein isoform X2 n=1 Tax=Centruroides vittatus TaxID=120091 RepID=UPI00350F6925